MYRDFSERKFNVGVCIIQCIGIELIKWYVRWGILKSISQHCELFFELHWTGEYQCAIVETLNFVQYFVKITDVASVVEMDCHCFEIVLQLQNWANFITRFFSMSYQNVIPPSLIFIHFAKSNVSFGSAFAGKHENCEFHCAFNFNFRQHMHVIQVVDLSIF